MATIICETESETDLLQMVYGQLSHWMFFSKSPLNFLLYLNLKTVLITPLNNRADKDLWSVDCALNTEITSGKFLFFFFLLIGIYFTEPYVGKHCSLQSLVTRSVNFKFVNFWSVLCLHKQRSSFRLFFFFSSAKPNSLKQWFTVLADNLDFWLIVYRRFYKSTAVCLLFRFLIPPDKLIHWSHLFLLNLTSLFWLFFFFFLLFYPF